MKEHRQTKTHNPPEQNGNCFATCVACILNLEIAEVPPFEDLQIEANWFDHVKEFAASKGYEVQCLAFHDDDGKPMRISWDKLHSASQMLPPGLSIATGKSPRGDWEHCVVAAAGIPVHDPAMAGRTDCLLDFLDWIYFMPKETVASENG